MIIPVFLARHGQTEWNRQNRWQGHTDVPLNDAGRAQARVLGQQLRTRDIVRAYASDLGRAVETATIAADILAVPMLGSDSRLRERAFGLFEGLTAEECQEQHAEHWQRYLTDRTLLPPGAEAFEAVADRMLAAIGELARAATGPALIVSHGSAIRSLVASATGRSCPPLRNGAIFKLSVDVSGPSAIVEALPIEDRPDSL